MENQQEVRKRLVSLSKKSLAILSNVLRGVTQEEATTWRDGADGWTILEIVCHLRDYDGFFRHRAELMRDQEKPLLPGYDHEALVKERAYNQQNLREAFAALEASRLATIEMFNALTEEQWDRSGNHPERGLFTLTDAALQVPSHDNDHTEQITRILADNRA